MNEQTKYISISFAINTLLVLVALLVGAIIYIFMRQHEPKFFALFTEIGLDNWINSVRQDTLYSSSTLPNWVVFSLPNGLWAFAYSLIITTIWAESKSKIRYFWLATIPVLVLGFEVLQLTETIRGTFCIQDMVSGIVGIIIGIFVGNKITKIKNHEKNIT